MYIRYPQNFRNGSQISIDWTNSFELNGKLREFILVVNGRVAFRGVAFNSLLDEETSKESKTVTTCNSSRFHVIVVNLSFLMFVSYYMYTQKVIKD